MTELLKEYKGIFFPLIGILLGFILTQIGVSYRSWLENRKNLKIVLFHLLETYYCVDRSNPDRHLGEFIKRAMLMITGQPIDEQSFSKMEQQLAPILRSLLAQQRAAHIKEISKDYQKSIQTLAAIAPFTAYYLSRRVNIEELFKSFEGFAEHLAAHSSLDGEEIKQGVNLVVDTLKPQVFEDSLAELELDIRKVAIKIDLLTWLKARTTVKKIKNKVERNIEKDLDHLLKELMPKFQMSVQGSING